MAIPITTNSSKKTIRFIKRTKNSNPKGVIGVNDTYRCYQKDNGRFW